MLVVCIDDLLIRAFVLLREHNWVASEHVQLGHSVKENVALCEEVSQRDDR